MKVRLNMRKLCEALYYLARLYMFFAIGSVMAELLKRSLWEPFWILGSAAIILIVFYVYEDAR